MQVIFHSKIVYLHKLILYFYMMYVVFTYLFTYIFGYYLQMMTQKKVKMMKGSTKAALLLAFSLCLPISSLILMFDIWFFDMVIICYWQNLTIYISAGFQLCSQFYHVELYYLYTVYFIVQLIELEKNLNYILRPMVGLK